MPHDPELKEAREEIARGLEIGWPVIRGIIGFILFLRFANSLDDSIEAFNSKADEFIERAKS